MSRVWQCILAFAASVTAGGALVDSGTLKSVLEVQLGSRTGQCRAVPVQLGHPLYRANRRLFGAGYNLNVLGGL